jgi:hypothetical protein
MTPQAVDRALVTAALVTASAAGACFIVGGALGIRQRSRVGTDFAYVVCGLAILGAVIAVAPLLDSPPEAYVPVRPGPEDLAAYDVGNLIAEATAIAREAAAQ